MECKREGCEIELIGRKKTFCSDRCRMIETRTESKLKHKLEHKLEQIDNQPTVADVLNYNKQQILDLLQSWREGKGTAYQYRLGHLAADYTEIRGVA